MSEGIPQRKCPLNLFLLCPLALLFNMTHNIQVLAFQRPPPTIKLDELRYSYKELLAQKTIISSFASSSRTVVSSPTRIRPLDSIRSDSGDDEGSETSNNTNYKPNDKHPCKSRIRQIRCRNLAGMTTSSNATDEIILNLPGTINGRATDLIAITGETGSGKSLLIGRVADLVTGGKASIAMIHQDKGSGSDYYTATAEMVLSLHPSHARMVKRTLQSLSIDPTTILKQGSSDLTLTRVLSRNGPRLKSSCSINTVPVPLKVIKAVGGPLLALVNAPAAAAALNKPSSRLYMLDTGVPASVLQSVRQLQSAYRQAKQHRQSLEHDLARHYLPVSMKNNDGKLWQDDRDLELLKHWVKELDGFEGRISNLRDSICASNMLVDDDDDCNMKTIIGNLEMTEWMDNDDSDWSKSSKMYRLLLDLLEEIKSLDAKIASSIQARTALSSLSSPDSAYTALSRARKLLLDATRDMVDTKGKVARSVEKTHEMLNQVEDALLECGAFLDDDKGLVATLEETRRRCSFTSEDLLEYITEWNTLSRKHGISPFQLPSCHKALRKELDGGLEARILLPKALEAEKRAMNALEKGCQVLTKERRTLCERMSKSITERLPLLGMGESRFEARLSTFKSPGYGTSHAGVDEVDFYLYHGGKKIETGEAKEGGDGKVENVASSGEKARILLAVECALPGSVRALCGSAFDSDVSSGDESAMSPVAVIYDEIDAHVGGRASISVAQMLVDQSRSCQVLSITHSPSLAALADIHICVSKTTSTGSGQQASICAVSVEGVCRQKELARMASGDMASEEAERFAKALLRDASLEERRQNATIVAN
ncbi:DNA repair protein RecN [Nitzschia inconspicua]|uniref:DNA repair protein RecN n=2 Tax=Nitzschia inconspicua TaxID=303405 RepID=A0A9K3K728_9STRA|nr:DNA repair protein RecN [Nitzschia inconspicua]